MIYDAVRDSSHFPLTEVGIVNIFDNVFMVFIKFVKYILLVENVYYTAADLLCHVFFLFCIKVLMIVKNLFTY